MIKRIHSNLFFVRDLVATTRFYIAAGFSIESDEKTARVISGDFRLAFMQDNSTEIKIDDQNAPRGVGILTYVEVKDVDEQFRQLKEAGIETSSEPTDWPWGKREFVARDPDGYKIVFYSPVAK